VLRNVELNAPILIQLQQKEYPNFISLTPSPTIEEVLINNRNESELGSGDFSRETFLHNISSISSPEIAEYVIERISPEEIKATNQGFNILKANLKNNYPKGLSKDSLVTYTKDNIFHLCLNGNIQYPTNDNIKGVTKSFETEDDDEVFSIRLSRAKAEGRRKKSTIDTSRLNSVLGIPIGPTQIQTGLEDYYPSIAQTPSLSSPISKKTTRFNIFQKGRHFS
jgi:hypothetical protein